MDGWRLGGRGVGSSWVTFVATWPPDDEDEDEVGEDEDEAEEEEDG